MGNYSVRLVSGEVSKPVPGPLHLRVITPMEDSLFFLTVSPSLSESRQTAFSLISFSSSIVFSYNSLPYPFVICFFFFPFSVSQPFYRTSYSLSVKSFEEAGTGRRGRGQGQNRKLICYLERIKKKKTTNQVLTPIIIWSGVAEVEGISSKRFS